MNRRSSASIQGARVALLALIMSSVGSAAIGQIVRQLTTGNAGTASIGVLDDTGTVAFVASTTNQFGTNPDYRTQIVRFDPTTTAGSQVTSFASGVSPYYSTLSVSDDGQWLAFVSSGDLTGGNHDQSPELFVMKQDGTSLAQLTSDPAVNGGSVKVVAMAGTQTSPSGKIAFVSNSDLVAGQNTGHHDQVFVIARDGSGLAQLTHTTGGSIEYLGVSDDGTRIVFSHDGNLTGGNADLSTEIFAILSDGSGLRQITSATTGASENVVVAGGGSKIAFQSTSNLTGGNPTNKTEIIVINWDGTGVKQLTSSVGRFGLPARSTGPSITDDGQFVFFTSNQVKSAMNTDGNDEVWKIKTDGTGITALTNTTYNPWVYYFPVVVSGSGNKVLFVGYLGNPTGGNPDLSVELYSIDGTGGTIRQLTNTTNQNTIDPRVSPDGSRVVFSARLDPFGTNPDRGQELFTVLADGTGLRQLTTTTASVGCETPSIAGDDSTIVFISEDDPFGTNPDHGEEVFKIHADGTGFQQLSFGNSSSYAPRISKNGAIVAFSSYSDLTGGNSDANQEIFAVHPDGTGMIQLTNSTGSTVSEAARIDASGTWVAFESTADLDGGNPDHSLEVYRIRTDGTGLQRITGDPVANSSQPDISASGRLIVYNSNANPLGTNPDLGFEVFLYDAQTGVTTQLTNSPAGRESYDPAISGSGEYVYFVSNAGFSETDPDYDYNLFRVTLSTGAIEPVGTRPAGLQNINETDPFNYGISADEAGDRLVFSAHADPIRQNPDQSSEIWLVDRSLPAGITVGKSAPTGVSWDYESGPLRYDVIRGDVASLAPGIGGTVNLGSVVCLENDSPDNDTAGFEDAVTPPPGHAFFYVYRGSNGLNFGPGSYGAGTGGGVRQASSGDCAP